MGDFTGIRCAVKLKKEMIEQVEKVLNDGNWEKTLFKEWADMNRSSFIPFGPIDYVKYNEDDKCFDNSLIDEYWFFQSTLKNYDGEIDFFIKNVLPVLAEQIIYLDTWYEYDSEPNVIYGNIKEARVINKRVKGEPFIDCKDYFGRGILLGDKVVFVKSTNYENSPEAWIEAGAVVKVIQHGVCVNSEDNWFFDEDVIVVNDLIKEEQ
ncbi:MAG: hypothetical protein GY679_02180 [Mycoplasma sp.]|nr:hypothetical protein [Mycoplasma sp.]